MNDFASSINSSSSMGQLVHDDAAAAAGGCDDKKEGNRYWYTIVLIGTLLLAFYAGVEIPTVTFWPKFAQSLGLPQVTESRATFMSSVLSGAYCVGRGASIFLATRVKTRRMLYGCMTLLTLGNGLLLFFSHSEPMLWVCLVILGFGHSCVIPAIMSMCEERINVTNAACSCFIFGSVVNTIITPAVLTAVVETTPLVLVYMNAGGLAVCFLLFALLHVIEKRRKRASRAASHAHDNLAF